MTEQNDTSGQAITGTFYYGGSSRSYIAELTLHGSECLVHLSNGDEVLRQMLDKTAISDPIGSLPYRICFDDGAVFETHQHKIVESLFFKHSTNKRELTQKNWVHRLEQNWRWAIVALLLVPSLAFGFLQIAMPFMAVSLAERVPQVMRSQLDQQVLGRIDNFLLQPSEASEENTRRLNSAWQKIGKAQGLTLLQRDGGSMGANAFALPGGTVIVTDQLLEVLKHENEIVAVLAHEIGHVHHDHGIRNIIQALAVAATISTIIGDVSWLSGTILVAAPTMLQQMAYSRDLEREADQFAFKILEQLDINSSCLGAGLSHLVSSHEQRHEESSASDEADQASGDKSIGEKIKQDGWIDYFSTHPAIEERITESGGTDCQ